MPEDRGHFNKYNTGTESFFTPGRQLADIAAARPDDPAVIYISLENKESVMSWKQLHELSNRIAWYLLGQGIGPGHSVIAALPNTPSHLALAFGIWKAGGCYVPVSDRTPRNNMAEICDAIDKALASKNGLPKCIVGKTVKGKGVSYMENQLGWHGMAPNDEQYKQAMDELNALYIKEEA